MRGLTKPVLCLLTMSLIYFISKSAISYEMTREAIHERIKPFGEVKVPAQAQQTESLPPQEQAQEQAVEPKQTTASAKPQAEAGKEIYDQYCSVCHAAGIAGAPKYQNQSDWQKRMEQGMDVMLEHAEQGYHTMPPKGTCMTCDPDQLRSAIEYMLPK